MSACATTIVVDVLMAARCTCHVGYILANACND